MSFIDQKLAESTGQIIDDKTVVLQEPKHDEAIEKENLEFQSLASYVTSQYSRAKDKRKFDEQRWLQAYANFRGLYQSEVQFLSTEKSRAFIKITKTKVLAAYAQIVDILFANNKFPIGVEATKVPEGILESVHFDPKDPSTQAGPQAPVRSSTVAREDIMTMVGGLKEKLEPISDKLKEGPGKTPTAYTFEPAKEAAKEMDKNMQDQLEEAQADKHLRRYAFDMALFGTGVWKGPFVLEKEYPRWDEGGKYSPLKKIIPDCNHVSIWNSYPDPDALNMEQSEFFIERHKLSKTELRKLKNRPGFRPQSIEKVITQGPNYIKEYWENNLNDGDINPNIDRWEALEYWGVIDAELAEKLGIELKGTLAGRDQIQVNVWICGGYVLRLVLNPFTPMRIPYYSTPYELNPYSFFGIGIAENMEDTQLLMNGFMRLAVDNAVLSSNVILDIDETSLADGQNLELFPGKVFRRQGGQPGQAINAINIPNVSQAAIMMFDKARQLADEATGMPSYSHGQAGVTGVGRTAAGMSMLMGAAKENIKAVVRNIDDYLLIPFGKALFAFNMQFNFDKKFIGDLEIVAKGTESLMRNEVRSQKLMQFLQMTGNPMDAPFVKRDYILRELATSLDLEQDKVVNDPREAAIQAQIMAEMAQMMGPAAQGGQGGNPASVPSMNDPTGTGGGNIAPGMAPSPGEAGNTGGGGGSPQAMQASAAAQGR